MSTLVLDSSALITLAGAQALGLLGLSRHTAFTVSEVYRETVEIGSLKAYPDAAAIGRLFEQGIVAVRDPRHEEKIIGVRIPKV